MLADFGHRVAHIRVGIEQMVVLLRFPVGKGGQFLRDGLEETNNHPNRRGLHIVAELLHRRSILLEPLVR